MRFLRLLRHFRLTVSNNRALVAKNYLNCLMLFLHDTLGILGTLPANCANCVNFAMSFFLFLIPFHSLSKR